MRYFQWSWTLFIDGHSTGGVDKSIKHTCYLGYRDEGYFSGIPSCGIPSCGILSCGILSCGIP